MSKIIWNGEGLAVVKRAWDGGKFGTCTMYTIIHKPSDHFLLAHSERHRMVGTAKHLVGMADWAQPIDSWDADELWETVQDGVRSYDQERAREEAQGQGPIPWEEQELIDRGF